MSRSSASYSRTFCGKRASMSGARTAGPASNAYRLVARRDPAGSDDARHGWLRFCTPLPFCRYRVAAAEPYRDVSAALDTHAAAERLVHQHGSRNRSMWKGSSNWLRRMRPHAGRTAELPPTRRQPRLPLLPLTHGDQSLVAEHHVVLAHGLPIVLAGGRNPAHIWS